MEVDVWCVRLGGRGAASQMLADLLSATERKRAASFHAEEHRQKFAISRGVLRFLLGHYLGVEARSLEFEYAAHGKPFVAEAGIHFNVAHSGEMALFAVGGLEVGIDIEKVRPLADLMSVAGRFFSEAEARDLASLSGEARSRAFHHCWARKEAYIKALGIGLSLPLESFRVSLLPGEPAGLLEIRGNPGLELEWLITDVAAPEDYAAALAVRAREIRLWTSPILEPDQLPVALYARKI
jgi:4'-phosphopantetheinyl transferase